MKDVIIISDDVVIVKNVNEFVISIEKKSEGMYG